MDGYKRMHVKLSKNLVISCLIFCGAIFFCLVIMLFIEYRFFNIQAQELIYLQSQYRKAISHVQNTLENHNFVVSEKKKMNMVVSL